MWRNRLIQDYQISIVGKTKWDQPTFPFCISALDLDSIAFLPNEDSVFKLKVFEYQIDRNKVVWTWTSELFNADWVNFRWGEIYGGNGGDESVGVKENTQKAQEGFERGSIDSCDKSPEVESHKGSKRDSHRRNIELLRLEKHFLKGD